MVFKGRFFSTRRSESSGSDSSNSPRATGSGSPIGYEKKRVKSVIDGEHQIGGSDGGFRSSYRQMLVKDGSRQQRQQRKVVGGKEVQTPLMVSPAKEASHSSSPNSTSKLRKAPDMEGNSADSPIVAPSLGLNRVRTKSGPLPQESFFDFRTDKGLTLGYSSVSRTNDAEHSSCPASCLAVPSNSGGKTKEVKNVRKKILQDNAMGGNSVDSGCNSDRLLTDSSTSTDQSPNVQFRSCFENGVSTSESVQNNSSKGGSGGIKSLDICTPKTSSSFATPKESESPRFQAILRVTSAPRKRFPADVKSFSHELNSKGVRPFPFWKPRGLNNLEEVLVVIRARFDKAKEEVDSDLAIFAGDLVGILEKNAETHPEWQKTIEDLLVFARSCAIMSPGEFWLQCEGIVQDLDDRRHELPMGMLKQLHTRMLFILTRCTRLLQFHKESGFDEDEHVIGLHQPRVLHSADKKVPTGISRDGKSFVPARGSKAASTRKSHSQEQHGLDWKRDHVIQPLNFLSLSNANTPENIDSPARKDRMASWKKFPSPLGKSLKESIPVKDKQYDRKLESLQMLRNSKEGSDAYLIAVKPPELHPANDSSENYSVPSKHQQKASWGYNDQKKFSDDNLILCRICEEEVPTSYVEDHLRICAIADTCDLKGLSVDERLVRFAETLEKTMEYPSQIDFQNAEGSLDIPKVSRVAEESNILSPKSSDWSCGCSEDMLDCLPESDNSIFMDDLKVVPSLSCITHFCPNSDQGMASSASSMMTPRSPLLTPSTSQMDLSLAGKCAYSEHEDFPLMNELADIARCVANASMHDERSLSYLVSCIEDLRVAIDHGRQDALVVEIFGARIEKLLREKYLQLCELLDEENVDMTETIIDENATLEDDVVHSLRTSPMHSIYKDRTSIDDFEIIKPISRGAFGRVFLAKKRTTGDLFAIKVLKKADMIRKNAAESIFVERDILISVCNPFVVRFFYSFTCHENLYLVMEYLNGGDLYSLLRNLGCLDEAVARVYIAEVVLALEYLHSLRVVHRDVKPDNLLIAHDGHIKLTDFGLSKVGLINSTDDLSGPAISGASLLGEIESQLSSSEHFNQRERQQKRSAVGTPDYLAPEILLGMGHGTTADWWSVGVILFELIVGVPPFNAEHPQTIFDNILNRKVPWPRVPEEMSFEAEDLIDRLLTEDPNQRLGAKGALEVKHHIFFKDINWDTLSRQKAAFVPASESALDTSYFTSRYSWNTSDVQVYESSEFEDSIDHGSESGSSSCLSNQQGKLGKQGDECGGLAEFDSGSSLKYSFRNFSFKNLSQLASINYDLLTEGWKDDPPANPNA